MEITKITRDSKAIAAGRWFGKDEFPALEDAEIRVRGLSAPDAVKHRARLNRDAPDLERQDNGSLTEEANERIFRDTLVNQVLMEWRGFTSDGKLVPYTIETATEWMTNPDYSVFADIVVAAASRVDETRAKKTETLSGNSPKSSAGKSKTTK